MTKRKTKPPISIDLAQVEQLAARGLSQQQIAYALGISERTLYARKKENADFADAIKKGRALGVSVVAGHLMRQIERGNITAIIFYLKAQAGWKETQVVDNISTDGSMTPKPLLTEEQVREALSSGLEKI